MKVLVTGANGFVGKALCHYLSQQGIQVVAAVRRAVDIPSIVVLSANDELGWHQALQDCDAVVHLAGQSQLQTNHQDSLLAFRECNVEPSVALARRAVAAGVRRYIFLSTAKVNGEQTGPNSAYAAGDPPAPEGAYAQSKLEAEQALRVIALETGLELVVIRPPLVYGPGVKGNFASMVSWVKKGIPLPLGSVNNKRSMVGLDNLLSLIERCLDPQRLRRGVNQTFLVSDGVAISTAELLRQIAIAYGLKTRLFSVPVPLLRHSLKILGKASIADRVLGSLVLDDALTREVLGWSPSVTLSEQLHRMCLAETS
jgi:nucleoside-diphosphate-sugar epimerase